MITDTDKQLNLRQCHPEFQQYLDYNESESSRVRENYNCHLNVQYGEHPLQAMDIFPSSTPDSPILIFIHGGYWRGLDKKSYSFVAEPFIQQHFTVAVINYRLIPEVDMTTLVNDVKQATLWIQKNAALYNGNPQSIVLSGHSAGGHLALITYLNNKELQPSICSICSISGLFDLKPIQNSYLNETLQLSDTDVNTFSPIHTDLSKVSCPLLISVGGGETALFIEQSKQLHLKNRTNPTIEYLEYEELNHYQIVHQLGQEQSFFTQFIFNSIRK